MSRSGRCWPPSGWWNAFIAGSGTFSHGFTYSGNPFCTFVGLQVLQYALAHRLFEGVSAKGELLRTALEQLAARHQIIGDVRGLGLFAGLEFVADRASREPFPEQAGLTPQDRAGGTGAGRPHPARRGGRQLRPGR